MEKQALQRAAGGIPGGLVMRMPCSCTLGIVGCIFVAVHTLGRD